jgi:choline transport protein
MSILSTLTPKPQAKEPSRYLDLDDLQLEAVGYRREMPTQFSLVSLGALSFASTCTWLGTGSSMGISITEASAVGTTWSLPIAVIMTEIVSLGIAEFSSVYPVVAAQYYWSFMAARQDYKPFTAFVRVLSLFSR